MCCGSGIEYNKEQKDEKGEKNPGHGLKKERDSKKIRTRKGIVVEIYIV